MDNIKIGVLASNQQEYDVWVRFLRDDERSTFKYIEKAEDLNGIKLATYIRLYHYNSNPNYDARFRAYLKASLVDQNAASKIELDIQQATSSLSDTLSLFFAPPKPKPPRMTREEYAATNFRGSA